MDNSKPIQTVNYSIDPAGPVETIYRKVIITRQTFDYATGGYEFVLNMVDGDAEKAINELANEKGWELLTPVTRELVRIHVIPKNQALDPYWWDWPRGWDYIPWDDDIDMYDFAWTARAQKPARAVMQPLAVSFYE